MSFFVRPVAAVIVTAVLISSDAWAQQPPAGQPGAKTPEGGVEATPPKVPSESPGPSFGPGQGQGQGFGDGFGQDEGPGFGDSLLRGTIFDSPPASGYRAGES